MANAVHHGYLPFEEYLKGERDVDFRSEYLDGQIYSMAGASERHNTIASDLSAQINIHLPDECRSWQSDMKVIGKNRNKDFAYYPDIMAACGENTGDQHYRTNPVLIVEVLSPSTKRIDMTEKLDNYTSIDSLLEYLLVSQDTPYLLLHRRRTNWQPEPFYADDTLHLESTGLTIDVKQIYRRVRREVGLEVPSPLQKGTL